MRDRRITLGGSRERPLFFVPGALAQIPDLWQNLSLQMSKLTHEEVCRCVTDAVSYSAGPDFISAAESLIGIPLPDLAAAFEILLDDPESSVALGIARAIGILNCAEASGLVARLIDEPGKWFGHAERHAIQHAAIQSAGILKKTDTLDALNYVIQTTREPEILMEAVNSIGEIGSVESVEPLLDQIRANPAIALSAAGALVKIGGDAAFKGLLGCLASTNEMVVSASVWALGKMGDPRSIEPLIRLLNLAEPDLRMDIAWSLGQIGGAKANVALAALSQSDEDSAVRKEASKAIRNSVILGNQDPSSN